MTLLVVEKMGVIRTVYVGSGKHVPASPTVSRLAGNYKASVPAVEAFVI